MLENGANVNLQNGSMNTPLHWACINAAFDVIKLICEWKDKNPDAPECTKVDANLKNAFGRVPLEEALQAGKSDIAEYLAPMTKLEDEKTYSVIPEATIYAEGNEDEEEEKKESSDDRSMQSEEARHPEDYQSASQDQRRREAELRKDANRAAAEENRLDEIS